MSNNKNKAPTNKQHESMSPKLSTPPPQQQSNKASINDPITKSKSMPHVMTAQTKDQETPRGLIPLRDDTIPLQACMLLRAARTQSTAAESDLLACGMTEEELSMLEETQNVDK